jgi:hypothetical protein
MMMIPNKDIDKYMFLLFAQQIYEVCNQTSSKLKLRHLCVE